MKKKLIIFICLCLFPYFAFTEEENQTSEQDIINEVSDNTANDQVVTNFPHHEDLINNSNVNETNANLSTTSAPRTFPIETTLGYNLDNADSKYFLQAEGTDILNTSIDRKINFLIKVPYVQIKDSTNTYGMVPEKFKLNFIDPLLNVQLGDNKYNLSPLTIKDLEKRGGLINFNYKDRIGLSSIYLISKPTKDKNPSDNYGASLFVKPFSFMKLSSNFLFSEFEKEKFLIPTKNYTYSFRTTFFINEKNKLDLETATTNKIDKKHLAYFANLDGKNKYFTYLINWVYANPNFMSNPAEKIENTISDRTKLDGSIKYKFNKFGAKLSHIFENYNFDKLKIKEHAKRSRSSEFSISYPILNSFNTSIGLKTKELKNLLNHDGYKLDAIDLDITIPIKKFSIDTNIELGKYKSRFEDYFSRNWQGYKLFLKFNPTNDANFSIYSKIGNQIYEDIFTKTYLAGADIKLKAIKNLDFTLAYEYSINTRETLYILKNKNPKWKGNYLKQDFTYTLPNQHRITVSSRLNKPLEEKKEKVFLITYTIPFEVPNISRAFSSF